MFNWRINKDFYLKNPKSMIRLKKCIKKMVQLKLVKMLGKYPKLKAVTN